jgi:hypothetical protein
MTVGRIWKDETFRYQDPHSGREIVRLTNYLGHSNHLYFTDPCWIEDNKSFMFTSDRENRSNLFRYDLDDHTITQLTDLQTSTRPGGCFSQANMAHYFPDDTVLYELDIHTLELRTLYEAPDDFLLRGRFSPTAEGKYVCGLLMERAAFAGEPMISYSYSRFVEFFEKRPSSRIVGVEDVRLPLGVGPRVEAARRREPVKYTSRPGAGDAEQVGVEDHRRIGRDADRDPLERDDPPFAEWVQRDGAGNERTVIHRVHVVGRRELRLRRCSQPEQADQRTAYDEGGISERTSTHHH